MKKYFFIFLVFISGLSFVFADSNFIHLESESQFNTLTKNKLVFVDFYADWCGPCQSFAPVFEAVASKLSNYTFLKINTDEFGSLSGTYNVRYIPHIVALKDGKEVAKFEGSRTESGYKSWCDEQITKFGGGSSTTNTTITNNNTTRNNNTVTLAYEFSVGSEKGYISSASNKSGYWIYFDTSGKTEIYKQYKVDSNYYYFEDEENKVKYAIPTGSRGDYYVWKDSEWQILFSVTKK